MSTRLLEEFVGRGQRAQAAVDAIAIVALVKAVREHVGAAMAWNADRGRRNVQHELEAAQVELAALSAALAHHLERGAK